MPRKFAPLMWRPFDECFGSMSVPSESQLFERLEFNLDYYKVNYISFYLISFIFVGIVRPFFAMLALPLVTGLGYWLALVHDQPIVVQGKPLTNREVSVSYLSLSLILLMVFGNLPLLLSLLSVTIAVLLHAMVRQRGMMRKAKVAINKRLPATQLDKAYAFVVESLDHAFGRDATSAEGFKVRPPRTGYSEGLAAGPLVSSPSLPDVEGQLAASVSDPDADESSFQAPPYPYGHVYTAPPSATHAGHPYMVPTPTMPSPQQSPPFSMHQRALGTAQAPMQQQQPPSVYSQPQQPYIQQPYTPTVVQSQHVPTPGSYQGSAMMTPSSTNNYPPAARAGYSGYMAAPPPTDPQQKQNFLSAMSAKYGQ